MPALVLCTVCTWYVSLRAVFQVGGVRAVYQTWTLGWRVPAARRVGARRVGARVLYSSSDNGIAACLWIIPSLPVRREAIAGMGFRGAQYGRKHGSGWAGPPDSGARRRAILSLAQHKGMAKQTPGCTTSASNSAAAASAAAAAAAAAADAASAHSRPPDAQQCRAQHTSTQHRHSPLIATQHLGGIALDDCVDYLMGSPRRLVELQGL